MHRFLCGRLVLALIGIVGLLQLIHIILLNRLESRQRKNVHEPRPAQGHSFEYNEEGEKVDWRCFSHLTLHIVCNLT